MKTACFFSVMLLFFSSYQETVYIQPLGKVQNKNLKVVQDAIKSVYGYNCVILPAVPHNKKLYANSKIRYDANKVIQQFISTRRVLVITEKDIAHYKRTRYPEWGIFGLGSLTNNTCVVSTYRIGPPDLLPQRLAKVAVHEIGHTLGLNHCTSSVNCVMQDAKGTVKTVDKASIELCSTCKRRIE